MWVFSIGHRQRLRMFLFRLISTGSIPVKIGSSFVRVGLMQLLTYLRDLFKGESTFLQWWLWLHIGQQYSAREKWKGSSEVLEVVNHLRSCCWKVSSVDDNIWLLLLRCWISVGGKRLYSQEWHWDTLEFYRMESSQSCLWCLFHS